MIVTAFWCFGWLLVVWRFGVSGVGVMGVSEFWRSCMFLCVGLSSGILAFWSFASYLAWASGIAFGVWSSGVIACFCVLVCLLVIGVLAFWRSGVLEFLELCFSSGVWGCFRRLAFWRLFPSSDLAICRRQKGTIWFHGL